MSGRAALAACAKVRLKISGLGERGLPWSIERNGQVVRDAIEIFDVERCMFASNFPVDSLVVKLNTLLNGFKAMVADRTPHERLALFHDNAVAFYGL